jgi:hypothetical protein
MSRLTVYKKQTPRNRSETEKLTRSELQYLNPKMAYIQVISLCEWRDRLSAECMKVPVPLKAPHSIDCGLFLANPVDSQDAVGVGVVVRANGHASTLAASVVDEVLEKVAGLGSRDGAIVEVALDKGANARG